MNRIAVICSGNNQLPLVQTAIDMGYFVIVISAKFIDYHIRNNIKYYIVDLKDLDKLYTICRKERIRSICSVGMEQAVIPIAYINGKFNFCGITNRNAHICTNKHRMKEAFNLSNVPYPNYCLCNVLENIKSVICKCQSIGFPVVFKPKNLCSSIGVIKIINEDDVFTGLTYIKRFINETDNFIIEKYIYGESFGIEVFVSNGKIRMILPLGNLSFSHDGIDKPIGHFYPYIISPEELEKHITDYVKSIIDVIGVKNSFLTIDCRLDSDKKIYFLEIGARCGGVLIPELLSYYYNCNVYKLIILQSLGYIFNDFLPSNTYKGLVAGYISTPTINVNKKNTIYSFPEIIKHNVFKDSFGCSSNSPNTGALIVKGDTPYKAIERFNEIKHLLTR